VLSVGAASPTGEAMPQALRSNSKLFPFFLTEFCILRSKKVNSLRSNSKLKIQNSKLKTITGGLYPPLIVACGNPFAQRLRQEKGRPPNRRFWWGLVPKIIKFKKILILHFEFCILHFELKNGQDVTTTLFSHG